MKKDFILSERERETIEWYDRHGEIWANQRKKIGEPSFWDEEYRFFQSLKKPDGKLLEIGSGSGREAIEWIRMGFEYTGIDPSASLIQIAKKNTPEGRYFEASVYEMPFDESSFDAFSSWALLPHVPKERIGISLDAIRWVLKPGAIGFMAMREGSGEKQEAETGRWFSYYLQEEFEDILKTRGFEILSKGRKPSRPGLVWLTFFVRSAKSSIVQSNGPGEGSFAR